MNKFELISKTEYDKVVSEEFNAKNGVIGYQLMNIFGHRSGRLKEVLATISFHQSHSN